MALSKLTIDPVRTAIAMGFSPKGLIADQVLRRRKVEGELYVLEKLSMEEAFDLVPDEVGRTGQVNQAKVGSKPVTGQVIDHGLDFPVSKKDIGNTVIDKRTQGMKSNLNRILRNREKRVADLVFNASTYPAGNKVVLSGDAQWSHPASTPIEAIKAAANGMPVRPNTLVIGRVPWSVLQVHSNVRSQVLGTGGGVVTPERFAEVLEGIRVIVGDGFFNSANKNKPFAQGAFWGKHAALLYLSDDIEAGDDATFGLTAQHGERYVGEYDTPNAGLYGGVMMRVGESLNEHIVYPELGYFFQNAVA